MSAPDFLIVWAAANSGAGGFYTISAQSIGKNVLAATNALSCANMALAGFDQVIPFDEVVDAVSEKFGFGSVQPASLLRPKRKGAN